MDSIRVEPDGVWEWDRCVTAPFSSILYLASVLLAATLSGIDFSKDFTDPEDRDAIKLYMTEALDEAEAIVYRSTSEEDLKLWIYRPTTSNAVGPRERTPAIVFIHGGGWGGGHASYFAPQAYYFAQRGILSVTLNYRLTNSLTENIPRKVPKREKSYIEDCVRDAKSAMRWLRSRADELGIDPDRIVVSGGSAGAHIAMCLGTMNAFNNPEDDLALSPHPNAMILFNPAIDFIESEQGRKIGRAMADRLGLPLETLSPAHLVDTKTAPTLILSGEKDTLIPPALVYRFLERMAAVDRPARFVEYAGAGHGFFNFWPARNPYFVSTIEKADEYLVELGYLSGEPDIRQRVPWYTGEPAFTVYNSK